MAMRKPPKRSAWQDPVVLLGALLAAALVIVNIGLLFAIPDRKKAVDPGAVKAEKGYFTVAKRDWYYKSEIAKRQGDTTAGTREINRQTMSMKIRTVTRNEKDEDLKALKGDTEKYNEKLAEKYGE